MKNTGSVPLTGVAVTDVGSSQLRSGLEPLAAGASTTYTCTSTVNAGFTNTASTTGETPTT